MPSIFLGDIAVNMENILSYWRLPSSEIYVVGILLHGGYLKFAFSISIHPSLAIVTDFSSRFYPFSTLVPLGLRDGFMTQSYRKHSPQA